MAMTYLSSMMSIIKERLMVLVQLSALHMEEYSCIK